MARKELWFWRVTAAGALSLCAVLLSRGRDTAEAADEEQTSASEARAERSVHSRGSAKANQAIAALEQAGSLSARCTAIDRLAHVPHIDDAAVAQIARFTEADQLMELRRCAGNALGLVDNAAAIEPLVALANAEVPSLVELALSALASRPENVAHKRAIALVKDRPRGQRVIVASALASTGAIEAVPFIAQLLEESSANADTLLMALGSTGDARAIGLLQKYLQGGTRETQRAAVSALGEIGGPTATQTLLNLLETRPELLTATVDALARSDGEGAREALLAMADKPMSANVQSSLLNALSQLDGPDVRALMLKKLGSAPTTAQFAAIEYFAGHGDDEAVSRLVQLVHTGSQSIVYSAMMALPRIGTPAALDALEEIAQSDSRVAGDALERLAQSGVDPERAQRIAQERMKRNPDSLDAIRALTNEDTPEARAMLSKIALSGKQGTSMYAMQALGQRTDPEARELLAKIAGPESSPETRTQAMWVLAQSGDPSVVKTIRGALSAEDDSVRQQAVQSLAQVGGPEAEEAIFAASRDKNPGVASTAAGALAQIGTPAALARVEELAHQPETAAHALMALVDQSPPRALKLAETMIASTDIEQRRAALAVAPQLPSESSARLLLSGLRDGDNTLVQHTLELVNAYAVTSEPIKEALLGLSTNTRLPEELREYAKTTLTNEPRSEMREHID